jgi:hypothetical protein
LADNQTEFSLHEHQVYLFEEALLCVTDDKRKGLGKIVDGISGGNDRLRLKGRVYLRHIRQVDDSSSGTDGELSLTITMEDDALDKFVMTFKDRQSLEVWKTQIDSLVDQLRRSEMTTNSSSPEATPRIGGDPRDQVQHPSRNGSIREQRSATSVRDSIASSSAASSAHTMFTRYTRTTTSTTHPPSAIAEEDDRCLKDEGDLAGSTETSGGASVPFQLDPSTFTPIDLMLILSVPSTSSSSFDLKLRLLKASLEFIIANVGPRARISVVTYSVGEGTSGVLRKTPFLHVGKRESRSRLVKVVQELGQEEGDEDGGFSMIDHKEDRVNVGSAVNLGTSPFQKRFIQRHRRLTKR